MDRSAANPVFYPWTYALRSELLPVVQTWTTDTVCTDLDHRHRLVSYGSVMPLSNGVPTAGYLRTTLYDEQSCG